MTWTLESAVALIRELEPKLSEIGFHCGLTGGSLFAGSSDKDVDVIVYPHQSGKPEQPPRDVAWTLLTEILKPEESNRCEAISQIRDNKDVRWMKSQGRRIDFLFLE